MTRKFGLIISLSLFLFSCGVDNNPNEAGPEAASALAQLPAEDRRIAIVHSATTRDNFYDPFAYNQLFASMQQQAMMAGVPFDLLSESDVADTTTLLQYDALLMPEFSYVPRADRAAIRAALLNAQAAGVAIVTSGEFMSFDASGQPYGDSSAMMADLLGLNIVDYLSGVAATLKVATADHPATNNYTSNEELISYDEIWFASFAAVDGEQSTVLTTITASGATHPGLQVVERQGRVLHFANEQIMADNNLLWTAMQWAVYGDVAPVALQITRNESVFIGRNDMDQAMIAADLPETEIPLLEMIEDWKRDYDFVSSYYIDIGNNPAAGQYTDWGVSAPLYQQYIALGNEIGTHSWTHPHFTSSLSDAQLEFEFNQSKNEIASNLGVEVIGGAVPGTDESLAVVENLNKWFKYFSGRTGTVGTGYPNAIGFLEPQHDMLYFSLNMSPDFYLIDVLNKTPSQALDTWKAEIDQVMLRAQKPVIHWLWHDYGPTTQTAAGRYSKAMFEDTLAYAKSLGTEFTTLANMHDRFRSFKNTKLTVGTDLTINATIDAEDVGQFSLKLAAGKKIQRVANWYAYDDNQVFLPETGGRFSIKPGATADPVSRVTSLPARARLKSLSGDGNELSFSFEGKGEVTVRLSPGMTGNTLVNGASWFSEQEGVLTLKFNSDAIHNVVLTAVEPINRAPVADAVSLQTETLNPLDVTLTGSDLDNDTLSYRVLMQPGNGVLTGTEPTLSYVSNVGFSGVDIFSYVASDGVLDSPPALVEIDVQLPRPANSAPVANRLVLATLKEQPLSFLLSGSDNEGRPLTYDVIAAPLHGVISGTAPTLLYTPAAGYFGLDKIQFTVSDGEKSSEPAEVIFNVEPQLSAGGGTISNAITGAIVDGSLNDWQTAQSFGVDPVDATGTQNTIDWKEAWMGHDASKFYIAYQQHSPVSLSWGHSIYIDTDTSETTGFLGFAGEFSIGVDYAIEGNTLFRYTGITQNEWSWQLVGSIESSVNSDWVELSVARSLIGSPTNMRLFFVGYSSATGGTALDYYPDDVTNTSAVLKDRRFSYSVDPNQNVENIAPVANAQQIDISNNAQLAIVLTGSDLNNDTLTYRLSSVPQNGTVTGTAPDLVYQPDRGYQGSDSLVFTVKDGALTSNPATVLFNVVAPPLINSRPVANSASVATGSNTPITVLLSGNDADGGVLTYTVISQPTKGVLSGTAPNLTYTPNAGESGVDTFNFKVNDGSDDSGAASVSITVTGVATNLPPVANAQNLTTAFETAIGVVLTGTDAEDQAITFSIVAPPTAGSLQGTAPDLTYVPFNDRSGIDSFSFTVSDGVNTSDPAVINIDVQPAPPVNLAPVANGQTLTTPFGQPLSITLTATDPEASVLTYSIVGPQPVSGVLTGSAPDLTYTPAVNFSGLDSFRFVASDGSLSSAEATVTIDVGEQPDGAASNLVSGLVVDGVISDWVGVTSFGPDPDDVTGPNNPLDWREAWVAHSATDFYFAFRNDQAFQPSWGHGIFIDVDGDPNTGFRGFGAEFPIGADYLIEAYDVHKYTGTGQNWSWTLQGSTTIAVNGDTGEISLPRAMLGNPTDLQLYLRAVNTPFGGIGVDHYPDSAIDAAAPQSGRALRYTTAP